MKSNVRAVEICNIALGKIGQDPIKSIYDSNPRAEACRIFFKSGLEACLKMCNLEFSKKTIQLTKQVDRDGYQMPPNMVTALGLRETCCECEPCEAFHLDSDVGIVISDSSLYINKPVMCACGCECEVLVYTSSDYEDLPSSPLFNRALSSLIASDLAIKFTANQNLSDDLLKQYSYWIGQASRKQTINHDRTGDKGCHIPFFKCKRGYLL